MTMTTRLSALLALTALSAACSRSPEMDAQMRADLDAASTATVEMAPRGPATKVVSAIESKNPTRPTIAPVKKTVAPARTPRPETPTVVAEEPVAKAPAPAPPRVQPPPPGGYKTVGEVIRNAPFPIKP
jgi:hypothetical protein